MVDGFGNGSAPGEWPVMSHQDGRTTQGIAAGKRFDDDVAGIFLVIRLDSLAPQEARTRNRAVKIVGVSGSERRQLATSLSPGRGKEAVRVDDASNRGEMPV